MDRDLDSLWTQHNDHRFRTPIDLAVGDLDARRVLVVGSCFSVGLSHYVHRVIPGAVSDHILYNFAGELPEAPPHPIGDYAFQLIVLPLRTVAPETMFFPLKYDDIDGYDQALVHAKQRLLQLLDGSVAYHARHGLTTFVANFLAPQQNSMGRLLPQNDARNPAWFVRELNDLIADYVADRPSMFLCNVDEISSSIGRRHIQDDIVVANSHGAYATDWDFQFDQKRLQPPNPLSTGHDWHIDAFILSIWAEIAAMYRTVRQVDSIKLVICDLDDTLWRGVIAEEGTDNVALIEGWPLGVIEALTMLKRRGILLAIVSKNDEGTIRRLWDQAIGARLPLSDFAAIRINWDPKAQNVEAVLRDTNLLARNALFIDDNPVEREGVRLAHPAIRTLGDHLYHIRRILMWAPELQVATITRESAHRTEMVQKQVEREKVRQALPREEFLASLNVEVTRVTIDRNDHPRYARAVELINKSNQFNTTGRRWSPEDIQLLFAGGGRLEAFEVRDRFTEYGLVAVAIVHATTIEQFVMSCRVLGLDVELKMVGGIARELAEHGPVFAASKETDANLLCRDLYARLGFEEAAGGWSATRDTLIASDGAAIVVQPRPASAAIAPPPAPEAPATDSSLRRDMMDRPDMPSASLLSELLSRPDGQKLFSDAVIAAHQSLFGSAGGPYDIDRMAQLSTALDCYQYAAAHMDGKPRFADRLPLLTHAVGNISLSGPVLEFGVYSGHTINHIASLLPNTTIYGFDSFEGLPEAWVPGAGKGSFAAGGIPQVRDNVELVAGWFDRTLPKFLDTHPIDRIALLHVDCDIYSSTQTIFAQLHEKIVPGTIIVFDEYFNYPDWRRHEFRAFQEFVSFRKIRYEYIGLVPAYEQVAVRILS